jgi:5-methylcytosine-specific restriction endonuclease McrA
VPVPSHEHQLTFLNKLQRLFSEGDFTATYKFALLIALSDLAVEADISGDDDVTVSIRQIAERFIGLYWSHVLPYSTGAAGAQPDILVQNNGVQAKVVTAIARFRATGRPSSLEQALTSPAYPDLVRDIAQTVSAQPLTYLQNFGGGTDAFIYERLPRGMIRLKPGVAYCMRRFHGLIQQMARAGWIAHIKANQRNHTILGRSDDLEDFLFATSRQSLIRVGEGLRRLEGPACFYCAAPIAAEPDVDHFVPFGLYARDLAHNFVLAHPSCNRSKSDTLAARPHLEKWLTRLERRADDIADIGSRSGVIVDPACARKVARWCYDNAIQAGASAWLKPGAYVPVDTAYAECF